MNKKWFAIKACIVVLLLFIITTIIPGLLSAANDLAVLTGTMCIVGIIATVFIYFEEIINWFTNSK